MRPPEFTGGNSDMVEAAGKGAHRFNEAAGIHRRKRARRPASSIDESAASMRPPEFTGGNSCIPGSGCQHARLLQ